MVEINLLLEKVYLVDGAEVPMLINSYFEERISHWNLLAFSQIMIIFVP